jgi:cell division protein ZapA
MNDDVSIKVKIVDRIYPLRVPVAEEQYVRQAAMHIDQRLKDMKDQYGIQENKDLLAMVALELATDNAKHKAGNWIEDNGLTEKIEHIDGLIAAIIG